MVSERVSSGYLANDWTAAGSRRTAPGTRPWRRRRPARRSGMILENSMSLQRKHGSLSREHDATALGESGV